MTMSTRWSTTNRVSARVKPRVASSRRAAASRCGLDRAFEFARYPLAVGKAVEAADERDGGRDACLGKN